jgi:hypothetical protein
MSAMGRKNKGTALAIACAVTAMLIPAAAQANTVTLGSRFQGTIESSVLDGGAGTVVNPSLPAPLIAGAPSDGTIVDWRFTGGTTSWIPQVVRPLGSDKFTELARGPAQQGAGVGTISGPFSLAIPVKQGDLIGVIGTNTSHLGVILDTSAVSGYFVPPLAPGDSRAVDHPGSAEDAVSATLRFCLVPSLKGKKPKAAKKALKAADCAFGGKKKSKKRRKKKKVVGQGVAPGTSISDTAPVAIKVSQPKKK